MKLKKRIVQKSRITFRKIAVATTLTILTISCGVFVYLNTAVTQEAFASTSGDYRSKNNGVWSDKNTWQIFNGTSWNNATVAPSGGGMTVTIKSGHTVLNTSGQSLDNVVIESSAILNHTNGTFKINNGNNKDIIVNGLLNIEAAVTLGTNSNLVVFGTVEKQGGSLTLGNNSMVVIELGGLFKNKGGSIDTSPNQWVVKSGGTYDHADNGNSIPRADWQSGSTCLVSGTVNSIPGNLDQDFWNFTWNSPLQNQQKNLASALQTIKGDLTVVSTGTGSLLMNQGNNQTMDISGSYYHNGGIIGITEGGNWVVSIGGNLSVNGGFIKLTDGASSNASGNPQIRITGDLLMNAGSIDMSQYSGTTINSGLGTLELLGDFNMTGGTITETSTTIGRGQINFIGTREQNYIKTGGVITQNVGYKVAANSILNMANQIVEGTSDFVQEANAKIIIGSDNGISSSGNSGNVQVSGLRTFSTSGVYEYRSTLSQNSGSGLPTVVKKLIISNISTINLLTSVSISDSLILNSGTIFTGTNIITLGTAISNVGKLKRQTGSVDGNFKRWIPSAPSGAFLFPLSRGGRYLGANLTYSSNPSSAGAITASFISGIPGGIGLPLIETGVAILNIGTFGVWDFARGNGLNGGSFTLTLEGNGFTGINDFVSLRILTRTNSSALWTLSGTHLSGQGSNTSPIARRSAVNIYGQFAFGGAGVNPLPITLTKFNVKNSDAQVMITWSTATELNNDYFDIERSIDGKEYMNVGRVRGGGTSNKQLNYSYYDKNPLVGTSYYRLRQTDYDGTTKAFDPKSVSRENMEVALTIKEVYPNPFVTELNCRFESDLAGEAIISLTDMNGRIVKSTMIEVYGGFNEVKINSLEDIIPGYYIFNLQIGESRQSIKVLKKN